MKCKICLRPDKITLFCHAEGEQDERQSTCFLGNEKYMTDCNFVQDEPLANSSTQFNSAQITSQL